MSWQRSTNVSLFTSQPLHCYTLLVECQELVSTTNWWTFCGQYSDIMSVHVNAAVSCRKLTNWTHQKWLSYCRFTAEICSWISDNISSARVARLWFCSHGCHNRLWGDVRVYKHGDYRRCLQLSTQNVRTLWYARRLSVVPTLPEFIQFLEDDIVSLTALTVIVNPEFTHRANGVTITQVTLSLYLMTQCQLKLHHSMTSLAQTLHYINVAQIRHPRWINWLSSWLNATLRWLAAWVPEIYYTIPLLKHCSVKVLHSQMWIAVDWTYSPPNDFTLKLMINNVVTWQ